MTYVTEQTSQELRAHMRRLKAMTGWHEPLADRLYKEILELDDAVSKLREAQAVQPAQQPFAWYDPSADRFTRDMDDPSMNRGAVLWRLFLDAQPSAERPCPTCAHFKQGSKPLVGVYDADCFECKHYYASKWEKKP